MAQGTSDKILETVRITNPDQDPDESYIRIHRITRKLVNGF